MTHDFMALSTGREQISINYTDTRCCIQEYLCLFTVKIRASMNAFCILFSNNLLRLALVISLCKFLVSQELGIHSAQVKQDK
jgi:hypothetical protein